MSDFRDDIQRAKQAFPLPDVLRHYGLGDRAKKGARSPFRDGDNSSAFGIFQKDNGDWNWKDFVTGEFGDEIDFIAKYENRSNDDAIIKYLDLAGVERGPAPAPPRASKPAKKLRRRFEAEGSPGPVVPVAPVAPFDWTKCVEAFTSKVNEIAQWRGLTSEFVESLRVNGLIGLHDGQVAFPVMDDAGMVIGCHYRVENGTWRFEPKGTHVAPLLIGKPTEAKEIFVFESQWDALAVADKLGWHEGRIEEAAFIITRGASNGGLVAGLLNPEAKVTVWPQNDKPKKNGKIPAEEWFADVVDAANGHALYRVEIPKEHKDANDWIKAGVDDKTLWDAIAAAKNPKSSMLLDREFNFDNPPPKTFPVLWLGDVGVAKPCDLVAVSAQVKAGKSSVIGAIMACLISNDGDFLGFRGENQPGNTILHIDTEQSPEDHHNLVIRTLLRGNRPAPPKFLRSFCFTDLSIDQRKETLRYALETLPKPFAAVLIDGVADLCHDVNDPKEANGLVDTLYKWAIEFYTPLICVLHENPGTTTGKTRGHLGSQLERKAATNLCLEKDDSGKIEIFTEKARRGHIAKGTGTCFEWSDDALMHVSCPRESQEPNTGRFQAKYHTDDILAHLSVLTPIKTLDLLKVCTEEIGISKPNFYRLWNKIKNAGIVQITDQGWIKK